MKNTARFYKEIIAICQISALKCLQVNTSRYANETVIHYLVSESENRWVIVCSPPANFCVVRV